MDYEEFRSRAEAVVSRIKKACEGAGRDPATVQLMAVTKTHPAEAADLAFRYGLKAVGENRVQEGAEKKALAKTPISWELIGHLQSNKARLAAGTFDRIQSVDSAKLLGLLDRAAAELGRKLPVLLQVNAGLDPAKSGVEPDGAQGLLESALAHANLRVDGLMTIAPLTDDATAARRTFANLRHIRDLLSASTGAPLGELSMGMSGDFEDAIAEGSTLVRVGSALFGPRA
jgi:pyridoxal phosphate enzyme (YggS family)